MLTVAYLSVGVTTWLLGLLLCVAIIYYVTASNKQKNLPPTPGRALPLIGHLHLVGKQPHEQFQQWRKTHGDVFMLQMGTQKMVVLSGHHVIKEALVKQADVFSNRHRFHTTPNLGVLITDGPNWKEQRSVTLNIMREFGMGKNLLAEKIADEVKVYLQEISAQQGSAFNIGPLTNMCVSNVICAIIFGNRFDLQDDAFQAMMKNMKDFVKTVGNTALMRFFPEILPLFKYLPFDPLNIKFRTKLQEEEEAFTTQKVNERLEDQETSFVTSYIREMEKKEGKSDHTYLDKANLYKTISHLFIAGTETTASAISWCFLYILHHPEVGDKIHAEIVEHVGTERPPAMQDKPNLKYLQAVMLETLRIGNVVPLSVLHKNTQDAYVDGYLIPKGSQVVPNLYSVLMDEQTWGDPHNFRPERFLDDNNDVIKMEEFIPFSLGRRICLGESLARMELFLFLGATFQKYKILPEDADHLPQIQGVFGITMGPKPFNIRCVEREL